MDILRQFGDFLRGSVTAHKAEACYLFAVFGKEVVYGLFVEFFADVVMQVRTVAAVATERAIGDVDRQGDLIRNFLENDIVIVELQHNEYG